MFDRIAYKKLAKEQLKGRYKTMIFATLVYLGIVAIVNAPNSIRFLKNYNLALNFQGGFGGFSRSVTFAENSSPFFNAFFYLALIFINGTLSIAYTNLCIKYSLTKENLNFQTFLDGFTKWRLGVLGKLWTTIWTFLWALLFYIPGIVKSIAYSQTLFLLAEYPKIGVRKATQISKTITNGYKGDLFIMRLSFIGWDILSLFTFGILQLWIMPYREVSFTNAYHKLLERAIRTGSITLEDLGLSSQNSEENKKDDDFVFWTSSKTQNKSETVQNDFEQTTHSASEKEENSSPNVIILPPPESEQNQNSTGE